MSGGDSKPKGAKPRVALPDQHVPTKRSTKQATKGIKKQIAKSGPEIARANKTSPKTTQPSAKSGTHQAAPRSEPRRCFWAEGDPLLARYHDEEWGVPVHDDRHWYEKIVLDGAQAGLSWLTILRKRDGYRRAFAGFVPERVARFTEADVERLMKDAAIVRNRAKIRSAISNARAFLTIQKEHGSFDRFIWDFIGGRPLQGKARVRADIVARTPLSDALSVALRARGFSFVGSTIVYAFMQAAGIVNDHLLDCFRRATIARLS